MTTWRRDDVVLVPFAFTDHSGAKWRPAVIVSSDAYNRDTPDFLIASITGNLAAISHPGDHLPTDWQAAGLVKPSPAQAKVATIEASIVGRKLGRLSDDDLAALDRGLLLAFALH